ncbi:hypothetical protein [Cellulomonas rhizosphaerae]|uniref:Uncharacterized protein n=1 Tax=Cellulomonas rhizosphaerae TaxID=2293719 RepID=A0A413RJJ6_9CELL|nr:hypothetical protein [Cellulomonas rhizosphaerae]RHA38706.1 hypothetical protein D1825_13310 [Cellulomonas rhizosphaerae]
MNAKDSRDAGSGRFVKPEYAAEHPETTVTETRDQPVLTVKAWLDCAISNLNNTHESDLSKRINLADDAIRAALDLLGAGR